MFLCFQCTFVPSCTSFFCPWELNVLGSAMNYRCSAFSYVKLFWTIFMKAKSNMDDVIDKIVCYLISLSCLKKHVMYTLYGVINCEPGTGSFTCNTCVAIFKNFNSLIGTLVIKHYSYSVPKLWILVPDIHLKTGTLLFSANRRPWGWLILLHDWTKWCTWKWQYANRKQI